MNNASQIGADSSNPTFGPDSPLPIPSVENGGLLQAALWYAEMGFRVHPLQVNGKFPNRRFANGLTFEISYTLLDQKTTALDTGNSSLGGPGYNQFQPELDFSRDS